MRRLVSARLDQLRPHLCWIAAESSDPPRGGAPPVPSAFAAATRAAPSRPEAHADNEVAPLAGVVGAQQAQN